MRSILCWAISLMLGAAVATPAGAQTTPNLSGTWVLQTDKSDFGPIPPPQSRTDVIVHQEPSLTIKRTVVTAAGESVLSLVYAVDGKPYKNLANGTELTSTLRWDGPTLEMVSILPNPQGDITITDRYTLSADGKTLTQDRTLVGQGDQATQKLLLTRQP